MANYDNSAWRRKGATLSDKTARKEYGLTQDEIVEAVRDGQLQYRENSIHGNPFLRLIRQEVEELIERKHGGDYLQEQQTKKELTAVNREMKRLKKQIAVLEDRKSMLLAALEK